LEPWRKAWRDGICPQLSLAGLRGLAAALRTGRGLVQGESAVPATVDGSAMDCGSGHLPVSACCAIGYALWRGEGGGQTVAHIEAAVAGLLAKAATNLAVRPEEFVRWHDTQPASAVYPALLAEVELAITNRTRPFPAPRRTK
jgi:hypothetical protein